MQSDHGIGDVVARTGVGEATLRMWERRYGFPSPQRLTSGHRRYSDRDIELIRRVADRRAAGFGLAAAIERVRGEPAEPDTSVFATLRRRRPDLEPRTIVKPILLALTHAVEDEALARAQRPILFGSFQRERLYRQSQARWRELARGARLAVVFADFSRLRTPRQGAAEVPVPRDHPLHREWTVVCEGDDFAVCLSAWEPPAPAPAPDRRRRFEVIWTVEPEVVREAARICAAIAAARRPELVDAARARLEVRPAVWPATQLRLATAINARALAHLSAARD